MRSLLSTVHGAEIASCFEQWAIKGVFLYLHKRKWIEEGRAEGRKEGTSMRPAGGLQTNRTFFLLDGDDSPLLRRFCSAVFQKNSVTAKTREGRFRSRNKSREEEFKNIYSLRCIETVCVWRWLLLIMFASLIKWDVLCSTTHCALM